MLHSHCWYILHSDHSNRCICDYFKHRDEWDYNWNSLKANALATATIIQSLGASSGSTGNLRQGYSRIIGDDFQQALRFGDILRDWAKALKAEYRQELSNLSTS